MSKAHRQFRDVHNGQFGFDGDFDRLCKCGHRLGVHGPAGVECLAGTGVMDDPGPRGVECPCTKFKLSGKRAAVTRPATTSLQGTENKEGHA